MNESGPAEIKVWRIFGPNSGWSCLGPLVTHLLKVFFLILAV